MRGVEAADVEGRVGLGVAQRLRVLQAFGKGDPLRFHAREDVVAGAVEDAVDAIDAVADEALAQGLDDRNAAGDGPLDAQREPLGFGGLGQFEAAARQHCLVGGDDRLAGGERRLRRGQRRAALAADQLHEDVDVGAARERDGIVVPGEARQVDSAVAVSRSRAHARYDDRAAAAHLQAMLLALEQPDHGGSDGAETGDTDPQGRQHERRSEFMEGRDGHRRKALRP